ncbi:MAG: ABC transporter permease, partial [Gammaproteobacteria bacterium]|nr:ABC transporter permease [Gammaproteobacteria bacterium]
MFWNNVKIAVRNLRKNKLFAFINIAGLAIGMTIYVFGGLLIKYEQSHDVFFEKSDRTYIIGAYAAPELDVGIEKMNTTFTAVGPIFKSELSAVEA